MKNKKNLELNWNMQKMFLVFYYTKCGIKGLPFESIEDFADFLKMTVKGLGMWEANFRYLMCKKKNILEHFSKEQSYIFCKYGDVNKKELKEKAKYYVEVNS
jgi:hypothetical protein